MKRVLVWVLILASSRASNLFGSDISIVLFAAGSLFIFLRLKLSVNRPFVRFAVGYMLLMLFYLLYYREITSGPHIRFLTSLIYAYLTIRIVGKDFFKIVSEIIGSLAILSLFLYSIQLLNHDFLLSLVDGFEKLLPIPETRGGVDLISEYANAIVYTVWIEGENSGFMWEPGAFSAVLSLGIWFNLVYNQFKLNVRLIAMTIALITTLTTLGMILLVILFAFYTYNHRLKLVYFPVLALFGFGIFSLEVVGDKIRSQLEDPEFVLKQERDLYKNNSFESHSLGRFGSFLIDLKDLKQNYVLGVGFEYRLRTQGKYLVYNKTNGLSDYLVKFGFLGIILLCYSLYRTATFLKSEFEYQGAFFLPLIVCLLAFSNPLLFTPLLLSLQIFVWSKEKEEQDELMLASVNGD